MTLFFAFVAANLAARMLFQVCGSETHAVALVDSWITELVRDRARAATLHFDLGSVTGFGLPFGFGLGLGFALEPRRVFIAGLPFGSRCPEALRGLAGAREQLV